MTMNKVQQLLNTFNNENIELNEDEFELRTKIEDKLKEFNLTPDQIKQLGRMIFNDYAKEVVLKAKTEVLQHVDTLKHWVDQINI